MAAGGHPPTRAAPGIYNQNSSTTVTNSTFSGISASADGGGIFGAATLKNTIVANSPAGGNCSETITDDGGNLEWPGNACGFALSADPKLGPLADNGGPTQTHALQPGSAAIDAAVGCPPPATDQRGVSRPQGGACDIGAFEFVPPPDTTPPTLTFTHTADGTGGWNKTSPVTLNVSASDSGSGLAGAPTCKDGTTDLTLTAGTAGNWTASVSGEGTHSISCSVSDKATNTTTASDTIKIDTKAPSASCSVTPSTLRTAAKNKHKLVDIAARVTVTDLTGGSGTDGFTLVSVTSNQADSGLGPGDVPNDIQGWTTGPNSPDTSGQLRAERYGGSRIYTLTYQGKDLAGHTAECKPTVTVPKGG